MTLRPISPVEVAARKARTLPDEVVEAFNHLIAKNWGGRESVVKQDDAVKHICAALEIERGEVFSQGLLEVEEVYRSQGWKVEYDKPGYCETYGAFFVFRKST